MGSWIHYMNEKVVDLRAEDMIVLHIQFNFNTYSMCDKAGLLYPRSCDVIDTNKSDDVI